MKFLYSLLSTDIFEKYAFVFIILMAIFESADI